MIFRRRAMLAYCLKCKTKREIKDTKNITMKNKRSAVQGVCPMCDAEMFGFLKKQIIETTPTQNPQLARQREKKPKG
jgi:hypothetical protein